MWRSESRRSRPSIIPEKTFGIVCDIAGRLYIKVAVMQRMYGLVLRAEHCGRAVVQLSAAVENLHRSNRSVTIILLLRSNSI